MFPRYFEMLNCISVRAILGSHVNNYDINLYIMGARGSVVVKALCYKPEGRGFETR
jgi:hypothetical protein